MVDILKEYIKRHFFPTVIRERSVVEAYNIWADNYDWQPGNLMLDLDKKVFNTLLDGTSVLGKQVADIGCGTGRHWSDLYSKNPATLTGFDVSVAMLNQLTNKFPSSRVNLITDNYFSEVADASFDLIISTLTIAHIENIKEALKAWSRIIKNNGEIIITDFHPTALSLGGKRTFQNNNETIAVKNVIHKIETIKNILSQENFEIVNELEIKVDENLKPYYLAKNALHVYEKFKGVPIIYGLHFKKSK